jgi:hypothetical protein
LHQADKRLNRLGGATCAVSGIISGFRPEDPAAQFGVSTMRVISLVALGVLASFTAAHAGTVTEFADRATFEAGFNSVSTEDFGDYGSSTSTLTIASGVLNASTSATNGIVTVNPGDFVAGVTFSTPVGTAAFFNLDRNYFFSGMILSSLRGTSTSYYGTRDLTVSFDAPQAGFGFDTSILMRSFDVTINFASGPSQTFSYAFPTPAVYAEYIPTFFGWESSAADITSVVIGSNLSSTSGLNFLVDNFSFAAATATPVPAALPLFASGLGAFGFLGWFRKKKAATLAV